MYKFIIKHDFCFSVFLQNYLAVIIIIITVLYFRSIFKVCTIMLPSNGTPELLVTTWEAMYTVCVVAVCRG